MRARARPGGRQLRRFPEQLSIAADLRQNAYMLCRRAISRGLILWLLGPAACSSGTGWPMADASAPAAGDAMAGDSADAADAASESTDADMGANVSFTQDVMPIFRRSCAAVRIEMAPMM